MNTVCANVLSSDSPFDLQDLLARCLGRMEIVERVLRRFDDALVEDVELLEQAVAATDASEIAQIAHRIKGASLAVSASELAKLAHHIESDALAQRLDDIPVSVAEFRDLCTRFAEFRLLPGDDNLVSLREN